MKTSAMTRAPSHQHHTVSADGATIAWSRTGAGDPVVLVHGITECAGSFQPVTDRLSATHEVITMDLRGHGESSRASSYDLASMAGDVVAVVAAAGVESPHLVGHSLGGAVVTAAGAAAPVASVVDIDQSLRLGAFKEQLVAAEPMLRDRDQYQMVVDAMFEMMSGPLLPPAERERVSALRRAEHEVVLGVWELLLREPLETIGSARSGRRGRAERPQSANTAGRFSNPAITASTWFGVPICAPITRRSAANCSAAPSFAISLNNSFEPRTAPGLC
jgi:pimeloyl-ACP methyl ester carboxylesterase